MVVLTSVLLVPKLAASLLSLGKLLQAGMQVNGTSNLVTVCENHRIYVDFKMTENLYQTTLMVTNTGDQVMDYSYNVR